MASLPGPRVGRDPKRQPPEGALSPSVVSFLAGGELRDRLGRRAKVRDKVAASRPSAAVRGSALCRDQVLRAPRRSFEPCGTRVRARSTGS